MSGDWCANADIGCIDNFYLILDKWTRFSAACVSLDAPLRKAQLAEEYDLIRVNYQ